ncbi:hypothetical protein CPC735_044810 [Coccidioides posadasii C735 delta SOWgp]|uniref:Uncharacterized protein n=2 Tax=Coccidioides posadasii TaxID=199306 RepID=A0A0J6HZF3_COCPO|nr:hypothetical protein CPC735_044810 [Coccidioides posadasii C735 delta SOWgp]EER23111.1 hypothetical protein CPC735_044810 [Coccidioides posadasii C735 delta SOWgp]KMM64367.1 hypothetical protein CPAG_00719 [Coccidioides posadasii RMSCC 3488]|eukprot:XP_003065256.1 hypothetical protein CPC735_044810 [Coccidioides posadasii C735 delta SOWgp]
MAGTSAASQSSTVRPGPLLRNSGPSRGTGAKGEMQSKIAVTSDESVPETYKIRSLLQNNAPGSVRPPSPLIPLNLGRSSVSPHGTKNASMAPSSPGRQFPSSPRTHSPASSQIFERSVQEDIGPSQTSPAIPSHIMTENHIPPILDASSAALTDVRLDPDSVEIITHNFHQPASLAVSGHLDHALSASWCDEANSQRMADVDDSASNYGAPHDPTDVRRLSFVSFADVVHGELAETADHISVGDSTYVGGLSTFGARNRSPSPFHSPVSSSHGRGTSPPASVSPESRALEISPYRKGRGPGSPTFNSHSPTAGTFNTGDLNIETMRQALRRTESGDLGAFKSQPASAVGSGDGLYDRPFR